MSMITEQSHASAPRDGWVRNGLHRLVERYTQYTRYRSTLIELRNLTDRELADLGLSRAMLPRIAEQAVYES